MTLIEEMNDSAETSEERTDVEYLCMRLASSKEVFLPTKQSDSDEDAATEMTEQEKYKNLCIYFQQHPVKFLQRYHELIKPSEISCFNDLPENEQVGYYIQKICHRKDLESRTELDGHYISHDVKNRRYRAMQKLIKEGEYFSEIEMEKRNHKLYQQYIGRYLTSEEKEQKQRERAEAHPTTLSGFFMDVIEKKIEKEDEEEQCEEEFDEDSEDDEMEEEKNAPEIPQHEKEYLAEEFKSRMYQSFLDGLDKNFDYREIDENPEYDDLHQIEQDEEDDYFDDEEPSSAENHMTDPKPQEEDELDIYMKTLEHVK